jgi:uncharacterized protein YgiB involved in biofilm formation
MDQTPEQTKAPRRFAARARPRLVLGGLAAAAGMSLTGCDSTPDFQTAQFTSVTECVSAGFPSDLCENSYRAAFLEHERTAPKFASQAACEKDWGTGQCAPEIAGSGTSASPAIGTPLATSGGNIFVPAIAGFLVSQALQRRYYDNGGMNIGYYGGGYVGSPVYRNRTGSTVTFDRSAGKAVMTPVNVNTRTVAQSGFGGRSFSRSYSGGGGSHSSFGG